MIHHFQIPIIPIANLQVMKRMHHFFYGYQVVQLMINKIYCSLGFCFLRIKATPMKQKVVEYRILVPPRADYANGLFLERQNILRDVDTLLYSTKYK